MAESAARHWHSVEIIEGEKIYGTVRRNKAGTIVSRFDNDSAYFEVNMFGIYEIFFTIAAYNLQ